MFLFVLRPPAPPSPPGHQPQVRIALRRLLRPAEAKAEEAKKKAEVRLVRE